MEKNKKKDLVIFELNECDFQFFLKGSKKYNYPLIKNFFNNKVKLTTFTIDKVEGYNLDPWVQWVTVHTGTNSSKHKVYRIGQTLDNRTKQIWEKIKKKKINFSLWGLFNANLRNKKNIDLFFPDPWSFTQKAYPKKYNNYLQLPRYYALNYPNTKLSKFLFFTFLFFKELFFSKSFLYLIQNSFHFLNIFISSKYKSFNYYFFLDLISLEILKNNLERKKSEITIIGLNSFAHYQHNFWDNEKFEKYYFWYLNEMIKKIMYIEKLYKSSICLNGFSQKKINPRYHFRPKDHNNFLKKLNIKFKNIKPNMTTGAQVFFNNYRDKKNCIQILKSININQKFFFEVQDYLNKKQIFFKFNIFSNKEKINFDNFNHKNFGEFNKKIKFKSKSTNRLMINKILKNVTFGKSTSEHINTGFLYLKSFKINKKRIQNHEIFKYIINHFK